MMKEPNSDRAAMTGAISTSFTASGGMSMGGINRRKRRYPLPNTVHPPTEGWRLGMGEALEGEAWLL